MIFGRKHLVLAALIIALGAAVYLNWQFTPSESMITDVISDNSENAVADGEYVSAAAQASATDASVNSSSEYEEEAVEAGKKTSYFDEARAERKKTRDDALAMIQEIIDNAALDSAQKAEAANTAAAIAKNMEKESSIESLVKAKGYKDCVVVISDMQVNVIIPAADSGLTAADAAIIKDIVIGQIEISPSCIKIIEAK